MRISEILVEKNVAQDRPYWSDLGNMTMKDKLSIFESYYGSGKVLESEEHSVIYFKGLSKYCVIPEEGKKYLVLPLLLIQDRIIELNPEPMLLKFISRSDNEMTFEKPDGSRTVFPKDFSGNTGLMDTFVFDDVEKYNSFRSALIMKFY